MLRYSKVFKLTISNSEAISFLLLTWWMFFLPQVLRKAKSMPIPPLWDKTKLHVDSNHCDCSTLYFLLHVFLLIIPITCYFLSVICLCEVSYSLCVPWWKRDFHNKSRLFLCQLSGVLILPSQFIDFLFSGAWKFGLYVWGAEEQMLTQVALCPLGALLHWRDGTHQIPIFSAPRWSLFILNS